MFLSLLIVSFIMQMGEKKKGNKNVYTYIYIYYTRACIITIIEPEGSRNKAVCARCVKYLFKYKRTDCVLMSSGPKNRKI